MGAHGREFAWVLRAAVHWGLSATITLSRLWQMSRLSQPGPLLIESPWPATHLVTPILRAIRAFILVARFILVLAICTPHMGGKDRWDSAQWPTKGQTYNLPPLDCSWHGVLSLCAPISGNFCLPLLLCTVQLRVFKQEMQLCLAHTCH